MKDKIFGVGVGVMIVKDQKVLLGLRNEDPEKVSSVLHGEGTWTMPGGKLDFGERLISAAIRETKEEIGTKLKSEDLKIISVTDEIQTNVHFTTIGFLCDSVKIEPKTMEPEEITRWEWFDFDNIPTNIYPPSKKILDNYFNKKIY